MAFLLLFCTATGHPGVLKRLVSLFSLSLRHHSPSITKGSMGVYNMHASMTTKFLSYALHPVQYRTAFQEIYGSDYAPIMAQVMNSLS
ncbi:uncharacterized protein BDW70DRAFT_125822 [Aspergillus foveolatus]|uniref:uncharacterized protein n=1 Tax=Aspergillus foveolatus TaxID=210207 RepID=UPI003CCDEDB8